MLHIEHVSICFIYREMTAEQRVTFSIITTEMDMKRPNMQGHILAYKYNPADKSCKRHVSKNGKKVLRRC